MKTSGIILIGAGVAGLGYLSYKYYQKHKSKIIVDPTATAVSNGITPDASSAGQTEKNVSAEQAAFNKLSEILEADPVWKQEGKSFPANFYDYVKTDYEQNKIGNPRTPTYKYGLPGSFMSIADAWWPGDQGLTPGTGKALWDVYNAYIATVSKGSLLSFNGSARKRKGVLWNQ